MEKPISFFIKDMNNLSAEIVQSLAKWKRLMLADYHFHVGEGLYTDMNAIRPDEILDNLLFVICGSMGLGEGHLPGRPASGFFKENCG